MQPFLRLVLRRQNEDLFKVVVYCDYKQGTKLDFWRKFISGERIKQYFGLEEKRLVSGVYKSANLYLSQAIFALLRKNLIRDTKTEGHNTGDMRHPLRWQIIFIPNSFKYNKYLISRSEKSQPNFAAKSDRLIRRLLKALFIIKPRNSPPGGLSHPRTVNLSSEKETMGTTVFLEINQARC